MIVKNEEAVIERALHSVIPFIKSWVIVDTGSTDRTKEIIQRTLSDISGILVDHPWVDFGTNRSEALALCDGRMDWALMLDADDNIDGALPPTSLWSQKGLDGFAVLIKHGTICHHRVQVFRTGVGWYYEGVLHEMPKCRSNEQPRIGLIPHETYMVSRCEGVRSRDPNKYLNDAALLAKEYAKQPKNPRTVFYLAQSYRDAGHTEVAKQYYAEYMSLPDTPIDERYNVLMNLVLLESDPKKQLDYAWAAIDLCPQRVEVQYALLNRWRLDNRSPTQQLYAIGTVTKNRTPDMNQMFVNPTIYEYGLDDEFAVVAYATGHYREAYEASIRCALYAKDDHMRESAARNARQSLSKCRM
jgi:glycosyltransferase involved in cell wall biosynthesis